MLTRQLLVMLSHVPCPILFFIFLFLCPGTYYVLGITPLCHQLSSGEGPWRSEQLGEGGTCPRLYLGAQLGAAPSL